MRRDPIAGRFGLAVLLGAGLFAGAACRSSPEGVLRLPTGSSTYAHQFFPADKKLLYLQGEYPSKTYLGSLDLASGKRSKSHVPEHRLLGSFLYLSGADQALVDALHRPGEAPERRLLQISLADGAVVKQYPLAPDAMLVGLAKPRWSDKAFALLEVEGRTYLRSIDTAAGVFGESVPVGDFPISGCVFLDDSPRLILESESKESPKLAVFDLLTRTMTREFPQSSGLDEFIPVESGLLVRFRRPGETGSVLALMDLETGARRELITLEGGIESMLSAGERVYLIAKDLSRPSESNEFEFHPRNLHTLHLHGGAGAETAAWTKRAGRFIGYDPASATLYFSATQPATAWALKAGRESLALAAVELDRRAGEFWGLDDQSWILIALALTIPVAGFVVYLLRPPCKNCG